MNIKKIFKSGERSNISTAWYKSISAKITFLIWGSIIFSLIVFVFGTLTSQRRVLIDRMRSEANDIAASIGQVTSTAIINNDYGFAVDHCLKILNQSNSIVYIVIVKNDGFALVHFKNSWHLDSLRNKIYLPGEKEATDQFIYSDLVHKEIFNYSFPFSYSGIEWGRINVGLSLERYKKDIADLYLRTLYLSILAIIAGFFVSLYFKRILIKPILDLYNVSGKVTHGDLNARAKVDSNDELGRLALSFNKMTESLKSSQEDLERKVEERTAELAKANKMLQNSLSEKDVLLKEIHHRVKNNLQVISSLLYLSSSKIKEKEALNLFNDSQNRVKSIALVHERLYQSKDLSRIDFNEYVTRLANDLYRSYSFSLSEVKLNINISDIFISIDKAVPCGLIINELISNSFKYAFPDREKSDCEIRVNFSSDGNDQLVLRISDNGIGLPEGFNNRKTDSLGLQLVETLVAQLEGTLEVDQSCGTAFIIKFKDAKK